MTVTSQELKEVTWTCIACQHDNIDLVKETSQPICGGCEKSFDWKQVDIDVGTYFGGEETTVKMDELVLIDKAVADSGVKLSKDNVKAEPFTTLFPEGKLPAYWGINDEYVPVEFD